MNIKNSKNDTNFVNFSTSMGAPEYWEYKLMMSNKDDANCLRKYEQIYNRNISSEQGVQQIPKVIHQIWLGPKHPPEYFEEYRRSWLEKQPDWEWKLWTDKEAALFDMELRSEFNASHNWGEKSDILRAEILDRLGGLYVDVDFECIKSFDQLAQKFDFFAGIEPPHIGITPKSDPRVTISNAIIGSCPGHPIIKKWKQLIKKKWEALEAQMPDCKQRVLERTFYTFGEAVFSCIEDPNYCSVIFPATYFYPLTFSELAGGRKKSRNVFKRSLRSLLYMCHIRQKPRFAEILPETMAVHHWGGSWTKSPEELLAQLDDRIMKLEKMVINDLIVMKKELEMRQDASPRSNEMCSLKKDKVN